MRDTAQRILRLAKACRSVAADVTSGRIRLKDLRRSYVFFDNGACGCAFGHALARAGLRTRLAPFFSRGSAGGREARWRINHEAYKIATGHLEPGTKLEDSLAEVEMANDIPSGEERRQKVSLSLHAAADQMDSAAVTA